VLTITVPAEAEMVKCDRFRIAYSSNAKAFWSAILRRLRSRALLAGEDTRNYRPGGTNVSLGNIKTTLTTADTDEIFDVFGPRIQFLTALSDADDEFCLIRGTVPAGVIVPVHSHAERETFYVLEGEVQGMQEESWITLVRNDTFDVPGGLRHAWRNIADLPASVVFVVPMRLARFLREIARPLATVKPGAPTPDEIQRFLHISHAYGYWVGGPADNAAVGLSLG
jgi:quercetin dioxygenase-like cupin family protein